MQCIPTSPTSSSNGFPRDGSFGSDSSYPTNQGPNDRQRSISQTSSSSYDSPSADYQSTPTDVSCLSNFNCWKVLKFIAGASIAAFGIVIAASGGLAFGVGVFISAPIGACICAAGLGMMGITVHSHFVDKKIAESEKNTRLIFTDIATNNYQEIRQLNISRQRLQQESEQQIEQLKKQIATLSGRLADKTKVAISLNDIQAQIDSLNDVLGSLSEQFNRLQIPEPPSDSIMPSPSTATSGHSSPAGPLPTGTAAWTSTQSHLSPLPISELHPSSTTSSPVTEEVPTAPYLDPATTDDVEITVTHGVSPLPDTSVTTSSTLPQ